MLAIQAIPASDITPGGLMHFGLALREVSTARDKNTRKLAGALVWQVLYDAGKFPAGTPVTMRIATVGGRKSVAEMIDSYGVSNAGVRQLLGLALVDLPDLGLQLLDPQRQRREITGLRARVRQGLPDPVPKRDQQIAPRSELGRPGRRAQRLDVVSPCHH